MDKVITITTDFGDQFAASQLRAVITNLAFRGEIIENHSVTPFSISEGAFEIKQIAKFSPSGSIHVGVIDPGVGSNRWGVAIKTGRSWLVGPNNGLLYPIAQEEKIKSVWRLQESAFGNSVTNTFHGRDIFVKAAVFLAQGIHPKKFHCIKVPENTLEKKEFLEGEIIHIDTYGNCKILYPHTVIIGKKILINTEKNKKFTMPVCKTFNDVPRNKPLAFNGSHGTLEIAINFSNAQRFFKFTLGEVLTIQQL